MQKRNKALDQIMNIRILVERFHTHFENMNSVPSLSSNKWIQFIHELFVATCILCISVFIKCDNSGTIFDGHIYIISWNNMRTGQYDVYRFVDYVNFAQSCEHVARITVSLKLILVLLKWSI